MLQNQKLHIENRLLQEKTNGLLAENEELRQRLSSEALDSKDKVGWQRVTQACTSLSRSGKLKLFLLPFQVQCLLSSGNEAGLGVGSSESAALRLRVPLQQVQAQQLLKLKTSQWIQAVLILQTLRWV